MKNMKKAVSLLLVAVMLMTLLTTTAVALPNSFQRYRVNYLDSYFVTLTIGDMNFAGRLTNSLITDEKLEELVQQALERCGLDEQSFDLLTELVEIMNRVNTFTEEDMYKIQDRVMTMFGAIPVYGIGFTAINIIAQIAQGRIGEAAIDSGIELAKDYGGKTLDILIDAFSDVEQVAPMDIHVPVNGPANVGVQALGIVQGLYAMVQGMMDPSADLGLRTSARVAGTEAKRKINDFYDTLNRMITSELFRDMAIVFEDAKAQQTFDFMGEQFHETWTLNMTLHIVDSEEIIFGGEGAMGVQGTYEGQYTIDIEYDLENIHEVIYQEVDEMLTEIAAAIEYGVHSIQTLANPGAKSAKRTLEGQASAYITVKRNRDCTITPQQDSDKKDVAVSDITIHVSAWNDIDDSRHESDLVYWADAENTYLSDLNNHNYNPNVTLPDDVESGPWTDWSDNIWDRGDDASDGWKISIVPTGKN